MTTKFMVLAKTVRSVYKLMEENEDLTGDLRTLRRALKWHCMWPTESEIDHNYGRFKLKVACNMILSGFTIVGLLLHTRKVKLVDPSADLSEDWSDLLTLCATLLVWVFFTPKVLVADTALKSLSDLYKQHTPSQLRGAVRRLSISYTVSHIVMVGAVVIYTVQQLVNTCGGKPDRTTYKCGIIVPFWMPFDFDFVPIRLAIFLVQFLTILMCATAAALGSLYAFAVTVHLSICVRHLNHMAKRVVIDGKVDREQLIKLVQFHQNVIRLMKIINDIAAAPLCIHLFVSSTLLGLLVHNLLNQNLRSVTGSFLHLIAYLISFFVNCMGGQCVLDESTNLSTQIYRNIKWYEMNAKERRDVLFIIVRCQKPLLLRTGSIGYMSLTVFSQVIKGIYYMSLLEILYIYK